MGCRTVQGFLGQTAFNIVRVVSEINVLKDIGEHTVWTVYPGPSFFISHF